jgi:hypothetical protein
MVQMDAAELASQARRGRFVEVLPHLLAVARSDADPEQAWQAAMGAIEILYWQDGFVEAAELAERVVRGAPPGSEVNDQGFPFVDAIIDAQLRAGVPAEPRLRDLADRLAPDSYLRERLLSAADESAAGTWEAPDRSYDFGAPVRPVDDSVIGGELLSKDFSTLKPKQKRVYWQALYNTCDFPRADDIFRTLGESPEQFDLCSWMAGCYALRGEVTLGEELLIRAHSDYWPFTIWDTLPTSQVVDPVIRTAVTERVREYYLTQPVGPEAEA